MDHGCKLRTKVVMLLEENIGMTLYNLRLSKTSLDTTLKAQVTTTKKNWTSSKLSFVLQRIPSRKWKDSPK